MYINVILVGVTTSFLILVTRLKRWSKTYGENLMNGRVS